MRPSSSQLRNAITYILLTASVLLLLNVYTSSKTRSMIFTAQQRSMQDKAQLMTTALLQLDELSSSQVTQTVNSLEELRTMRTVVTNDVGIAIYDSMEVGNAQGKLLLFPEIVEALGGKNVFFSQYADQAIESRVSMPLMRGGEVLGAVYLMEYDTDQGRLVAALEKNVLSISVALEIAIIVMSLLFSTAFSRRMQRILHSVRSMRDGDYARKIDVKGHDELARLGREFNELAERLEDSEERRRQFVSDASHELKTPLASIKLLSDSILQNQMDEETQREFISDIGREADRLGRLTQKLLTLTKLDSALEEEREITQAAPVIEKVVRVLKPMADLRRICLECEIDYDIKLLMVEDDLHQIVFNLTENAIKYNVDGGWVSLLLKKDGQEVLLRVQDSGVGIPEASMEHIFERFYRVDKARSRAAGGSGLGLSIVRDMVIRNYGTISASARENGGTEFTVRFPSYDQQEEEA